MFLRCILLQTILVIVASFVLGTVDSQTIEVHPPKIGVQTNEQNVVLSCNVYGLPVNTYIMWNYYPSWTSNGFLIYTTYDRINRDPTNFTVYHSTLGSDTQSLDLVINTAKRELATQYVCSLSPIIGFSKTAHVVVLDPVECPGSIVEYDVGDTTNIFCSVNYYDSTLTYAPNVMWYRDGQLVPGQYTIHEANTRKAAWLVKSVTLADDGEEFVCIVDFSDWYTYIMDYTDNCSTSFHVRTTDAMPTVPTSETGTVKNVSFYPPSSADAPITLEDGDVIECMADGRPEPTIEWYNPYGKYLSWERELVVTVDMRTWDQPIVLDCRATNTIDNGVTFAFARGDYTFYVAEEVGQYSGTEAWVIVVAVIVPIVVLAAIAIAIFFIIRRREMRKKSMTKTKMTTASTAALQFHY